MDFKVIVEHKDEFGCTMSGVSECKNVDTIEGTPADQLIYHFERAFESAGLNKDYIKNYYRD